MVRPPRDPDDTKVLTQPGRIDPATLDVTEKKRRKRQRKLRNRPEPKAELRKWEVAAEKRAYARPFPPGVMFEPQGFDEELPTAPHNDNGLWWLQLGDAFGTRSSGVISAFMEQLEALCEKTHWDEEAKQWRLDENQFSASLAIINSLKPRNELEAAHAAQMVAVHLMTMKVSARALKYDYEPRMASTAGKLARTFTLQREAFERIRKPNRTAKQNIKVSKELHQHVHYHRDPDPRGAGEATGNPMDRQPRSLKTAPRCRARNRAGKSCGSPAERGRAVCRFHGARAGAPKGEANGMFRHGGDTLEAVALRRAARALMEAVDVLPG